MKEINGSPFANLFSEACGAAWRGGQRRRGAPALAARSAGAAVPHRPARPGGPRGPSGHLDGNGRRRGVGFALASPSPPNRILGRCPSVRTQLPAQEPPAGPSWKAQGRPSPVAVFERKTSGPRKGRGSDLLSGRALGSRPADGRPFSVPAGPARGAGDLWERVVPSPDNGRARYPRSPSCNFMVSGNPNSQVWEEKGLPDAFLPGGWSSNFSAGAPCPATLRFVPPIWGLGFPEKFLFCSEEPGRKVVWARAGGRTEQAEDGCKGAGHRGHPPRRPSPSSPQAGGRAGPGGAGCGLAGQGGGRAPSPGR